MLATGIKSPVGIKVFGPDLAGIEAMADGLIAAGAVPGFAVGVVHDDAVVWTKGFGVRRVGAPEPVDAGTVFVVEATSARKIV